MLAEPKQSLYVLNDFVALFGGAGMLKALACDAHGVYRGNARMLSNLKEADECFQYRLNCQYSVEISEGKEGLRIASKVGRPLQFIFPGAAISPFSASDFETSYARYSYRPRPSYNRYEVLASLQNGGGRTSPEYWESRLEIVLKEPPRNATVLWVRPDTLQVEAFQLAASSVASIIAVTREEKK